MVVLAATTGICQIVGEELVLLADLGYAGVFFVLGAHPRSARPSLRPGGRARMRGGAGHDGRPRHRRCGDRRTRTAFAIAGSASLAALVAVGGWAAGYARWQNRARITAQVQAGLEQERTRIAADMHDLVAHTWAVVAAQADGARYALGSGAADRKAEEALRSSPRPLGAPSPTCATCSPSCATRSPRPRPAPRSRDALVERMRASGMDVRLVEHGDPSASGALAVAAQRLLAESLTNALKHGDLGDSVEVEEDWRDGYRLVVRNRVRA